MKKQKSGKLRHVSVPALNDEVNLWFTEASTNIFYPKQLFCSFTSISTAVLVLHSKSNRNLLLQTCSRHTWDHTLEQESVSEVLTGKEWTDCYEGNQVVQGQREQEDIILPSLPRSPNLHSFFGMYRLTKLTLHINKISTNVLTT